MNRHVNAIAGRLSLRAPQRRSLEMLDRITERDFIYVTTANLNHEQMQALNDEVGANSFARGVGDEKRANTQGVQEPLRGEFAPTRTLLVLCTAFRGKGDYPNLTVKKIPKQVLSRCEWGHDDYSLRVENLPKAPLPSPLPQAGEGMKAKGRNANVAQGGLFDETTSHSTKPASGQVAGYEEGEA
jgi:adenine-specific DNA-methyltransferase